MEPSLSIGERVVLERRLDVSLPHLAPVLDGALAASGPALVVISSFAPVAGSPEGWRAHARLRGAGRDDEVEVEVSAWSRAASLVTVRPVSRSLRRWRARRVARFVERAGPATDCLLCHLQQRARRPVRRSPERVEPVAA